MTNNKFAGGQDNTVYLSLVISHLSLVSLRSRRVLTLGTALLGLLECSDKSPHSISDSLLIAPG